jgi:cysteinyl-tRNA synthetase
MLAATEPPAELVAALEDDLNTPKAMAELFALARKLNKASDPDERGRLAAEILAAGDLLGFLQSDPEAWFAGHTEGELGGDEIEALLAERREARSRKDFSAADEIRDRLAAAGIVIADGPDGTTWRRTG